MFFLLAYHTLRCRCISRISNSKTTLNMYIRAFQNMCFISYVLFKQIWNVVGIWAFWEDVYVTSRKCARTTRTSRTTTKHAYDPSPKPIAA